ncbi:Hypothetical protein LOCK900_2350 [Lacticaseibacillus rhamnosus LOCK900]|nr:Hypothetical protein LOCK900_2350 [Lacticaseibacillus rhamnosus LOCK900]
MGFCDGYDLNRQLEVWVLFGELVKLLCSNSAVAEESCRQQRVSASIKPTWQA